MDQAAHPQLAPNPGKKRRLYHLFLFVLSVSFLSYLILQVPPSTLLDLGAVKLSILIPFFVLLFLAIFTLFTFLFNSRVHGFLLAMTVVLYFLFRLNNLTHPMFMLLLIALFLTLELLFTTQKHS